MDNKPDNMDEKVCIELILESLNEFIESDHTRVVTYTILQELIIRAHSHGLKYSVIARALSRREN